MSASQWVYPPPATGVTFFNTSILSTNLAIFLNASTSQWPTTGFGRTPTFDFDAMRLEWPSDSNPPPTRNWHCLPCRQLSSSTNETANWEACAYPTADALPELLTVSVPIPNQGDNSYTWNLNDGTSLPSETRTRALMCTFGIPSDNGPYYITQPFRFTNADRQQVTGQNFYLFNASAPEGSEFQRGRDDEPFDEPWRWNTKTVAGIAFGIVLLSLVILVAALCYINRKKKQKKALAAMLVAKEGEGDAYVAENGVAGVGAKEKNEKMAEGEMEEGLPRYEGPPGYTEATSSATSTNSVTVPEAVRIAK